MKQGIESEKAKQIAKAVKDAKLKAHATIQGDQLRVAEQIQRRIAERHEFLARAGLWAAAAVHKFFAEL